jgi:hypothetical protein
MCLHFAYVMTCMLRLYRSPICIFFRVGLPSDSDVYFFCQISNSVNFNPVSHDTPVSVDVRLGMPEGNAEHRMKIVDQNKLQNIQAPSREQNQSCLMPTRLLMAFLVN